MPAPPGPPEPPILAPTIDNSVETLLFEFLEEAKAAAADGTLLRMAELHDTVYRVIKQRYGLRVSDAVSDFAEDEIAGAVKEIDAALIVVAYARIEGKDKKAARAEARDTAFTLVKEVFRAIRNDPSLGGRVCDTQIQRVPRGYDSEEADTYALFHLPLIVNPTGEPVSFAGIEGANYV